MDDASRRGLYGRTDTCQPERRAGAHDVRRGGRLQRTCSRKRSAGECTTSSSLSRGAPPMKYAATDAHPPLGRSTGTNMLGPRSQLGRRAGSNTPRRVWARTGELLRGCSLRAPCDALQLVHARGGGHVAEPVATCAMHAPQLLSGMRVRIGGSCGSCARLTRESRAGRGGESGDGTHISRCARAGPGTTLESAAWASRSTPVTYATPSARLE